MKSIIWILVPVLAGCAAISESDPPRVASEPDIDSQDVTPKPEPERTSTVDRDEACQSVIHLAQVCYDNSNPNVRCADVLTRARRIESDLPRSVQTAAAELCAASCVARKGSISWAAVRRTLVQQCHP